MSGGTEPAAAGAGANAPAAGASRGVKGSGGGSSGNGRPSGSGDGKPSPAKRAKRSERSEEEKAKVKADLARERARQKQVRKRRRDRAKKSEAAREKARLQAKAQRREARKRILMSLGRNPEEADVSSGDERDPDVIKATEAQVKAVGGADKVAAASKAALDAATAAGAGRAAPQRLKRPRREGGGGDDASDSDSGSSGSDSDSDSDGGGDADSKATPAQLRASDYLRRWHLRNDASAGVSWKFNKGIQLWLLSHMYSGQQVRDEWFEVCAQYVEGLKGGLRARILAEAQAIVEDPVAAQKAAASAAVGETRLGGKAASVKALPEVDMEAVKLARKRAVEVAGALA